MDVQPSLLAMRLYGEGNMSLKRELDIYSKLVFTCYERVQVMHSISFNNEQCQYLVDKLKEVIESSRAFLKTACGALIESHAPTTLEKHLLSFKLFFVLATEIERFIQGCSQDAWVPAAMTLTNMSEFVSSMAFHLELYRVALFERCGAFESLTLDQVANLSKDVNEIVKTKASTDKKYLLKKLSLALPSLYGDKKDLASYLLQRLLRVAPTPSIPLPESKWDLSQYLTFGGNIFANVEKSVSIGRGSSATVFKAMWLEMEVAVKFFRGKNNPEFQKEVDILAGLCHPNIMSMFCYTQERQKCSIFMELMDGDLSTLMQERLEVNHNSPPFNIWEAIDIMQQIAEGGKYLHEQDIVHRDLKSMNIHVKSVKTLGMDLEYIQAKVADFNVSKIKKSNTTNAEQTMNVGSNRWMAPELIRLQWTDNQVNVGTSNQSVPKHPHKCDIYSFAIMVCFEILTGELPFMDVDNPKEMKAMILKGDRPNLPAQCPSELRALIEKCWNPKPDSRPTFDDICRELKYVKYVLMSGIASTFEICVAVERTINKYENASEDFNKGDGLEPTHALTLWSRGVVKRRKVKDVDALEDLKKVDELKPNDALTLLRCGKVKRTIGKFAEALEDLNKANELEPNDALILWNRGEVKRMMGKFTEALEDLNKANEFEPNNPFIQSSHRAVKKMMDKYTNALEDLNKANELKPNDALTLWRCAEVKRMMGYYEDALDDLNKANELEPNDPLTLSSRGEVQRMMGKYDDALEDLNKANELEPNNALTLQSLRAVKRMIGKYANALEDLNNANESKPNDALTLWSSGEVKRIMGKYTEALEDLNKTNELGPNDALTLQLRGEVKRMMGNYEDALEDLNKANELGPNDVLTLQLRGKVKRMMGNYEDALEDLNKANDIKPNDTLILRRCAKVKTIMGKFADALKDLDKVDELEPNDASILRSRGEVKRIMGNYADALEDLNEANELKPNDAFTLSSRGAVKKTMGKYMDALEDLNKANELRPNDTFTLTSRGEVKKMMGWYMDALEDLNKANELKPNDALTLQSHGAVKKNLGNYAKALEDLNKAIELDSSSLLNFDALSIC